MLAKICSLGYCMIEGEGTICIGTSGLKYLFLQAMRAPCTSDSFSSFNFSISEVTNTLLSQWYLPIRDPTDLRCFPWWKFSSLYYRIKYNFTIIWTLHYRLTVSTKQSFTEQWRETETSFGSSLVAQFSLSNTMLSDGDSADALDWYAAGIDIGTWRAGCVQSRGILHNSDIAEGNPNEDSASTAILQRAS